MYDSVYMARQPIFDRKDEIFAYELLFRQNMDSQRAELKLHEQDDASIQVASSGILTAAQEGAGGSKRMFINFTTRCIQEKLALALPRELVVVEVLEGVELTKPVCEALWDIKKEGYAIAVDDYQGQPERESLLELADYVKVDVLGLGKDDIRALAEKLHGLPCSLVAEKVDDHEMLALVRECGFDYFQGFFFALPENLGQRQLRSGSITRLKILEQLQSPDANLFELVDSIKGDVSLSYRLMRYIRSSSFSLPKEVKSIRQAALLLGNKKLKNWLRLLMLSDLAQGPAKGELPFLSLSRARFFECLAEERGKLMMKPGEAYLLGLFSLLEAMIEVPAQEIVRHMALPRKVLLSLVRREDSPGGCLLDLAEAIEQGDWPVSDALAAEMGFEVSQVVRAHNVGQTTAQYFLSRA